MGLCMVVALVMLFSGNENNFFGFPHTLLGLPGHRRSRLRSGAGPDRHLPQTPSRLTR
ncbi:hypothetical protein [Bifidobacterium indicum]|uniref:hypothetical protein n=1 Tax=Bifidobacterium indicum TaxID=1691 RepID=UPI0030D80C38